MNKEDFVKDHPGLKGMIIEIPLKLISIGDCAGNAQLANIATIHETQLDKQIVKDAIDDMSCCHAPNVCQCCENLEDLKKELGLEPKARIEVKSSNLEFVNYDENKEELTVWFKRRKEEEHYIYSNVSVIVFAELIKASSIGKFFIKNIKGNTFRVEK